MTEQLTLLIELQAVDSRLQELASQRGDLPEVVERLKQELTDNDDLLQQRRKELADNEKARIHSEDTVVLARENLKKYENQLYEVKNNKEYDAITLEIETTKKAISDTETSILQSMNASENIQNIINDLQTTINLTKKELQAKEKELAEKMAITEREELELNHEREKITVRLKKQSLATYEKIRNAKGGLAVVEIKRDACGGCFNRLPPQQRVEIRKMKSLITCESCGRIIINKESEET